MTLVLSSSIRYSLMSLPPISILQIPWEITQPSTMGTQLEMPSPHSKTNPDREPSAQMAFRDCMATQNFGTQNYSNTIYVILSLFLFGLRGASVSIRPSLKSLKLSFMHWLTECSSSMPISSQSSIIPCSIGYFKDNSGDLLSASRPTNICCYYWKEGSSFLKYAAEFSFVIFGKPTNVGIII